MWEREVGMADIFVRGITHVTVEDLASFAATYSDVGDEDVMRSAWS